LDEALDEWPGAGVVSIVVSLDRLDVYTQEVPVQGEGAVPLVLGLDLSFSHGGAVEPQLHVREQVKLEWVEDRDVVGRSESRANATAKLRRPACQPLTFT
jgi:hypothetical protein